MLNKLLCWARIWSPLLSRGFFVNFEKMCLQAVIHLYMKPRNLKKIYHFLEDNFCYFTTVQKKRFQQNVLQIVLSQSNICICHEEEEKKSKVSCCRVEILMSAPKAPKVMLPNMFGSFCNRQDLGHAVFTVLSTWEWLEPEWEKIMSRSLWAAYHKHSAVSSSKISLCCLSTI